MTTITTHPGGSTYPGAQTYPGTSSVDDVAPPASAAPALPAPPPVDDSLPRPFTRRWYAAHGRAHTGPDADPQGVYLTLLDSVGRQIDQVDELVRDSDSGPGWSALLDPDRTPVPAYLAQFVGVRIPGGVTDAQARALVVAQPATRRGTVQALEAAAQTTLTGSRYVEVIERDGGAYRITVRTYDTETPDRAVTEAALQDAKPAGLVLTHQIVSATSFALLEGAPTQTFTDLEAQPAEPFTALEG